MPRAVSDGVVRGVPADRVRAPAPAEPAPPAPGAGEDAAVAKLVHLIVKFSKLLETSGRLSEREAAVVSGLAERRDTVVLAAYTVAATAQDAEYLADLVRGVAADFLSVKTEDPSSFDGPAEHDTAARLLHAIDEMFCRNLLDMDKCRYLQTLVLYKDPAVFAAFDVFADDEDVDELFDTLLHVAARDDGGDGDDDDDDSGDDGAVAPAPQNVRYLQSPDRAAGPGRSVATETIPEGDEESASSDDDDDEPEELQLFRGAICREVDDLLTAGQLPAVAAKAVLVALQNEGLEEATSIDVALCRLARAAYDVYSIDGDRGELRNALLDACSAYGAAAGAAPAPAPAADAAEGPSLAGVDAEAKLNVLRECIAWLMNSGTIDESHAKALLRLTLEDDARVNGALEAYGRGGALEDFLASLAALAKHGAAAADRPPPPPAAAGPAAAAAPPAPPAEADVALKAADPAGAEAPDAEALRELSELIACLVDDGKLAGEELAHLERLVASRDARLLAAYDVYVDGQDVDDLVDTVMRVAKRERKLSNPPPVEANPGDAPPRAHEEVKQPTPPRVHSDPTLDRAGAPPLRAPPLPPLAVPGAGSFATSIFGAPVLEPGVVSCDDASHESEASSTASVARSRSDPSLASQDSESDAPASKRPCQRPPRQTPRERWSEVARSVLLAHGVDPGGGGASPPGPAAPPVVYVAAHAFAKGRVSPEAAARFHEAPTPPAPSRSLQ